MRFAIINNEEVTNIVEAEDAFGLDQGWIPIGTLGVGITDAYKNGQFLICTGHDEYELVDPFKIEMIIPLTTEERIEIQERENQLLKQQLEATQAVVDELLLGGAI